MVFLLTSFVSGKLKVVEHVKESNIATNCAGKK
jgi:hypothetical protein